MIRDGGSVRPNSVSGFDAIRLLYARLEALAGEDLESGEYAALRALYEGGTVRLDRREELHRRAPLLIHEALLTGELKAHFSDGLDARDIPGWAWAEVKAVQYVWLEGKLPLNVFLPEDWQRWSCHSVFLDRDAFTRWVEKQDLVDSAMLPELPPPYDAPAKPEPVKKRLPPDTPFVRLSEALTWIAFGFALDRDSLDRAISGRAWDAIDPQVALADAMAKLAVRASGGQIAARAKYVESHSTDENKVLTAPIDPVRFEDFAQFDILYDGLRYGTGLTWDKRNHTLDRVLQDRPDAFRSVKVSRADLLKLFPDQDDTARAFLVPLPASLPDIGPVMALDEALSWLAHRKPSHDIELWQNTTGDLIFRDPSGAIIESCPDGSLPPFTEIYRQASRTIYAALRDGSLPTYVAPATGTPLSVPRFYWNHVSPESLDHVYRGMTPDDHGAGCPVLLSQLAFDGWRAAITVSPEPAKQEKPKPKAERKRPGPAPDPDWPLAIAEVTQDCIAAGYKRPLERGGKAAIQTMLLNVMADRNKHFSEDIAAKHAEKVIAALPAING